MQLKEIKINKLNVNIRKSVENLGGVLRNIVQQKGKGDIDLQLLKMAQCLNGWEQAIQDNEEEARYQVLYGDINSIDTQRTQKLEEIIGLQYDINYLMGQKKSLQNESNVCK